MRSWEGGRLARQYYPATVISMDGQVDAVGLLLPGIILSIWVVQLTRRWRVGQPFQADVGA